MGRTALLACPEGGTSLSAMAGLDRSSFNTEPGLRSISFSLLWFCAVCGCRQRFLLQQRKKRSPHRICAVTSLLLARPLKMPAACALGIFSGMIIFNCISGRSADLPEMPFHAKGLLSSRLRQGWRPARWRRRCTASLRPALPAPAWAG